jgi:L-alanine-DL-glutamate epimerase-like enolase superfamily enzyme
MRFESYRFEVHREPFRRPFHFKGGFFREKWINITSVYPAEAGDRTVQRQTAIGGNAVLWSDPKVFTSNSETGGNLIMSLMAERAVQLLCGKELPNPITAIQMILPELHELGCRVSGQTQLRRTFTLNASVSLDLALWKLYAAREGLRTFAELIPGDYRGAFPARQREVARVPLVTYNLPARELVELVDGGHFLLKIKIGQPGSQPQMLEKDLERLEQIHRLLRDRRTKETENGRLAYYLDANGRYEEKETLWALIGGLEKMGALEQVALLEEPFPDDQELEVGDLPVRIAADESLHGVEDLRRKIELGYGAIALKPAGKTLSASILMAAEAQKRGVPSFVADSACVPLLLDWNRNVAAHLPPFPGLSCGVLESNGSQNYRNWSGLIAAHPCAGAPWLEPRGGVFWLGEEFYTSAGGVLHPAGRYEKLVQPGSPEIRPS